MAAAAGRSAAVARIIILICIVHGGTIWLLRSGLRWVRGALQVVVAQELQALLCPTLVLDIREAKHQLAFSRLERLVDCHEIDRRALEAPSDEGQDGKEGLLASRWMRPWRISSRKKRQWRGRLLVAEKTLASSRKMKTMARASYRGKAAGKNKDRRVAQRSSAWWRRSLKERRSEGTYFGGNGLALS